MCTEMHTSILADAMNPRGRLLRIDCFVYGEDMRHIILVDEFIITVHHNEREVRTSEVPENSRNGVSRVMGLRSKLIDGLATTIRPARLSLRANDELQHSGISPDINDFFVAASTWHSWFALDVVLGFIAGLSLVTCQKAVIGYPWVAFAWHLGFPPKSHPFLVHGILFAPSLKQLCSQSVPLPSQPLLTQPNLAGLDNVVWLVGALHTVSMESKLEPLERAEGPLVQTLQHYMHLHPLRLSQSIAQNSSARLGLVVAECFQFNQPQYDLQRQLNPNDVMRASRFDCTRGVLACLGWNRLHVENDSLALTERFVGIWTLHTVRAGNPLTPPPP